MSASSPPPVPPGSPPPIPQPACAVVDAGAVSTTYVRAGSGLPVLLLRADPHDGPAGAALFPALSRCFRVFEPDLAATCAAAEAPGREGVAFSAWLRGFLDGLGLPRASVVADEGVAARVLSFALAEPGRVDRLVLLYRDADDPRLPPSARAGHLGESGHPLLMLRIAVGDAGPPPQTVEGVLTFLGGAADDPAATERTSPARP